MMSNVGRAASIVNAHADPENLQTKLRALIPNGNPDHKDVNNPFPFILGMKQSDLDCLNRIFITLQNSPLKRNEVQSVLYNLLNSHNTDTKSKVLSEILRNMPPDLTSPFGIAVFVIMLPNMISITTDPRPEDIRDDRLIESCRFDSIYFLVLEEAEDKGYRDNPEVVLSFLVLASKTAGFPFPLTYEGPENAHFDVKKLESLNIKGSNYIHHRVCCQFMLDTVLQKKFLDYGPTFVEMLRERQGTKKEKDAQYNLLEEEFKVKRQKYLQQLAIKVNLADIKGA